MIPIYFLSLIALSATSIDALAFSTTFSPEKVFSKVPAVNVEKTCLDISLDVGHVDGSHIPIKQFKFELTQSKPNKLHPSMPGANGPNPFTSSGVKKIEVTKDGHFIDIRGTQRANLSDGCWEMVWRKHAFSGVVVCGFNVPDEIKRNDATLPSGRVYITFPVWKKTELMERKEKKIEVTKVGIVLAQEKDEEIKKMMSTKNIIMKALHFRNACAITEKITTSGYGSPWYTKIPEDGEVTEIENGYVLSTKGTVWTKTESFFEEKILLGRATIGTADSTLRP